MDGLAIGTAVVGLTQAAIKIARFLSSIKDAPSVVRGLLAEVRSMTVIFRHLDTFITDLEKRRHASSTSDILVDDLVVIVTSCVCSFSELEALLEGFSTDEPNGPPLNLWDRACWVAKEPDLAKTLANLQGHKTSITLLLTLSVGLHPSSRCLKRLPLTRKSSVSSTEARNELEQLRSIVAEMRSNPDMNRRMESFESNSVAYEDPTPTVRQSTVPPSRHVSAGGSSSSMIHSGRPFSRRTADGENASLLTKSSSRTFVSRLIPYERVLSTTRVYARATRPDSVFSLHSDNTPNSRQISGVSLARLSNLSLVCLPVYQVELYNGDMYMDTRSLRRRGVAGSPIQRSSALNLRSLGMDGVKMITGLRFRKLTASAQTSRLHRAAAAGNILTIATLLDSFATQLDSEDDIGRTALHHAAFSGKAKALTLLLEHGADLHAKDKDGRSPLHHAAYAGKVEALTLLVERGADILAKNNDGCTPLDVAKLKGFERLFAKVLHRVPIPGLESSLTVGHQVASHYSGGHL